jgi:hypothetical protein
MPQGALGCYGLDIRGPVVQLCDSYKVTGHCRSSSWRVGYADYLRIFLAQGHVAQPPHLFSKSVIQGIPFLLRGSLLVSRSKFRNDIGPHGLVLEYEASDSLLVHFSACRFGPFTS